MMLTIAHLSDVHLAPIPGLGGSGLVRPSLLAHLNVKRGLGLANWLYKRHKVHLRSATDALVADVRNQSPDHIIVSGDLCNLGLPAEYVGAHAWLHELGDPAGVTVVPGNHDIYCPLWRDPGVERWRAYMSSDAAGAAYARPVERGFPFVRLIGRLALVGLVSAVPTRPFCAIGRLGPVQLDALGETLAALGRDGFTRLVIIHHPPLPGQADARRGLVDAPALEKILQTHGAELVIHGHNHLDMHATRAWLGGQIDVVGVASASVGRAYKHEPLARYNLIRIDPEVDGGAIEIVSRGLQAPGGSVVETGRRKLGRVEAVVR